MEFWAPLPVGVMLMVMVYAGGHVSGGHYNPAISLAVYLRGKLALGELPAYIFAQGAGGVLAALLSGYLLHSTAGGSVETLSPSIGPALLAEFLGAFVLCYVFLHVSTAKVTMGNPFYGVVIGGAMMASMYAFEGISGGMFNPAIALGMSMAHGIEWSILWIYLLSTAVAGAVAAFVFNYVNGAD
jgi:aquaporin Z